ncbi:MAG: AAA family ATPase [Rhodopirellula sp.]|nr:AAA family ATPase [Rhodopirellula sp.]
MSTTDTTNQAGPETGGDAIERGTYEVIRNRLSAAGRELRGRLDQLNAARKEVFGAIETALLATERVTTDHHCVPRDMVAVGNWFLFGYNVHLGLKSAATLDDVFAVYRFENLTFSRLPLDAIADERFARDFQELFKYYRNTRFSKFAVIGPHLFMVFRTGPDVRDIKTFKWLIQGDRIVYLDNRSDHEFHFPPQHEFTWRRTHRDMHTAGLHPHISIEDRLFVETTEGDLTIKIENNTDSGEGIYAEPVANPDQTLDDAEIFYTIVGNLILLKIRPYQESRFRYFIYSEKTQRAHRIDSIENACVLLPDDHGLIFANGYFLQTGETKTFDNALSEMVFRQRVQSPNGEDYLYVFYNRPEGVYILLSYNLIEQQVRTPVICNGFSLFENGQIVYFKGQAEPQRHHTLQIWQTPYVGPDYKIPTQNESFLYKIGNRDIVRGMAECNEVLGLIGKEDSYANLFIDLAKQTSDVLDAYHWLASAEAFNLREVLLRVKETAEAAIGEFEKVTAVRRATEAELQRVSRKTATIQSAVRARRFEAIGDYVASLIDLRSVRGEIISLRSLRYIQSCQVDALEKGVEESAQRVAESCVRFLLRDESLRPYHEAVAAHRSKVELVEKVADAKELEARIVTTASELEMLVEIVSNLKIDDATERTAIIDGISAIFSQLNQIRAGVKTRIHDLMKVEGAAEFASQLKLLGQAVVNYLDVCDAPEKCEQYLTKMMVQIEELEGRFAEFDEFVVQLAEKREDVYNAFETRKLQLIEARNRRATALAAAADRILKGIKGRVDGLAAINEINGYFAADMMIEKIRDIVRQLGEMGDSVKVDDIQSRLKTIREDAVRQLKDRQDLYEEGDNVIRLGNHRFSVNTQAFDLTTVLRDGEMFFHLSGTNYFDRIDDPALLATRDVWSQQIISETKDVYRGEYLAWRILLAEGASDVPPAATLLAYTADELLAFIQRYMGPRYAESYVKGVHDHDAARILRGLLEMRSTIGLLRYHPRARALAVAFWSQLPDGPDKELIAAKRRGVGAIRGLFPSSNGDEHQSGEIADLIRDYVGATRLFPAEHVEQAAEYLAEELAGAGQFSISPVARDLCQAFYRYLEERSYTERYEKALKEVEHDGASALALGLEWVRAFLATRDSREEADYTEEAATLLAGRTFDPGRAVDVSVSRDLAEMVGDHPVIENRVYRLNYHRFTQRLDRHVREVVPRFEAYGTLKKALLDKERQRMRLEEFRPRVLTSFVRNKLIDQVYLPLVGDNLAKQIGAAGEAKRTDRMGMLLVISPPGYGKTTLMEYIANRLGLVFMKINGPALGHQVTSLDPAEAPNAAAREEMEKLNLSFEMGDNVMIYLDDIQHCNPELLQKFISLCDAQRKIEGVWRGRTRTYDLRGKKVAVVMAGNPYTESGEKFKIPDMLANRADTYNLGEVIGGNAGLFEMIYLENACTSNPVLNQLATRSQKDVYAVIRMAEGTDREGVDLEGNYSLAELNEMVAVVRKLMRVRDVVLRVNEEYIRSAGMSDDYRTEPPFKLQGSYRNMNRITERVVAVMNDEELEALILSSYQNDAQTLTTGAESNLLKFKELTGKLTPTEAERWDEIKTTFRRNLRLRGLDEQSQAGQVIAELGGLGEGLDAIRKAVARAATEMIAADGKTSAAETVWKTSFDAETLELLRSLAEPLKSLCTQPARSSAPAVEVVNKVPTAILSVLREQFRLMQGWMEPLHRQSTNVGTEIHGLRKTLEETLAAYQRLVERLEEAARKGDALYESLARDQVRSEHPGKP